MQCLQVIGKIGLKHVWNNFDKKLPLNFFANHLLQLASI